MNLLLNAVLVAQLFSALVMIGLVLIQHGKGADMGASFGSGASGSLFGATGSANFLSRSTAVCAAVFFVATLTLAYFGHSRSVDTGSVLDRPVGAPAAAASATPQAASAAASQAAAASAAAAPAASGAAQIPGR